MEHDSPKRGRLYLWFDERVGLSDFAKLAKRKKCRNIAIPSGITSAA